MGVVYGLPAYRYPQRPGWAECRQTDRALANRFLEYFWHWSRKQMKKKVVQKPVFGLRRGGVDVNLFLKRRLWTSVVRGAALRS